MKKEKMMTAEELIAKLSADPEYQKKLALKEAKTAERLAMVAAASRPILDELRKIGYDGELIGEIVERYAPLPDNIVQVLLHWLPLVENSGVREAVVRALGTAKAPYAGRALVDCFAATRSETLKFAVASAMEMSRPTGIGDWLTEIVQAHVSDGARGMLVLALAKHVPPEKSLPILAQLVDDLPGHVAKAFAAIGGVSELKALEARQESHDGWGKNEIKRAIRKIKARATDAV